MKSEREEVRLENIDEASKRRNREKKNGPNSTKKVTMDILLTPFLCPPK